MIPRIGEFYPESSFTNQEMDGATINGQQIKVNEVSIVFKLVCSRLLLSYMLYMNRPAPVVMEVVADVAAEDMEVAAVEEGTEAEAMVAAVAVVDMEVTFSSIKLSHLVRIFGNSQ